MMVECFKAFTGDVLRTFFELVSAMREIGVPVILFIWGLIQIKNPFDKVESQFIVIWSFFEFKIKDVLNEW